MEVSGDKQVRRRRSRHTVRDLTLAAAAEMFAENGYPGTSLRAVADRAGIAESQIVRNFGTKSALFTQSVIDPISRYVDGFYEDWAAHLADDHPYDAEELTRHFIEGLYDLFREHRRLLLALLTTNAFDGELSREADLGLGVALKRMEEIQAFEVERNRYNVGPITIRALVGLVMSMAVLDDFLYSKNEQTPNRDAAIDAMVTLSVHGVFGPDPSAQPAR